MKKQFLALAVLSVFSTATVWGMPTTILEKTEAMETTVYGQIQQGALVDRVNQLDVSVYGSTKNATLNQRVENLYQDVEAESSGASVKEKISYLEWVYRDKVEQGALLDRLALLERGLTGRESTGSVESRITGIEKVMYGKPIKITTQPATIGEDHVFKISLDKPLSTKENKQGDEFTFTVQEDILDGNALVIPAGTVGKGHIEVLKKAASFGRSAKLELAFDTIPMLDGTNFKAVQGEASKKKTETELKAAGASVAGVAILGPVGLVGGFFVKGNSIELPAGAALYVQPETAVTGEGLMADLDGVAIVGSTASAKGQTAETAATERTTQSTQDVVETTKEQVETEKNTHDMTKETAAEHEASAKTEKKADAADEDVTKTEQHVPDQAVVVVKRS